LDATAQGFCSVEADIYLVDGQLLVAHERKDVKPDRTLQSLYLDPLRAMVKENRGHVYAKPSEFTLLVDIKTDGEQTYQVLKGVLKQYADIFTEFNGAKVKRKAITAIISGERPMKSLPAETVRYAALDGHLDEMDSGMTPALMPWISHNWRAVFTWRGTGEIDPTEKKKLRELVEAAHKKGYKVRFWGTPDNIGMWREERAAGVDLLNTDDLEGCARFLQGEKKKQ